MKSAVFFTFLLSLAKAGLWISIGILFRKHIITILSLIIRRPIPDGLINAEELENTIKVVKWIGLFLILIGAGIALIGIITLTLSNTVPNVRFH